MSKRKTHEEYVQQVADINPNIEVIGTYIDAKTKILHKCEIDGTEWEARPDAILHGRGCPECKKRTISRKLSRTHEDYVRQVKEISPDIEVIGTYINSNTKVKFHCLIDDYIWDVYPNSILKGVGCPRCAQKERYTTITFKEKMFNIHPDIEIVGEYVNINTKVKCMCQNGHMFNGLPKNLYKGEGCPICAGNAKKTHEQYVKEVSQINDEIEVLGNYINCNTPIQHRCKKCNYIWVSKPGHVLKWHGCPICHSSIGERTVEKYLNDHSIRYIRQYIFEDCKNIRVLPFDFYLCDLNVCIEYDGIQHFQPIDYFGGEEEFAKLNLRDKIKTDYCLSNNIPLLRIGYNEDVNQSLDKFLQTL